MNSRVSPFVTDNINLLKVLCNPVTKRAVTIAIFKTANKQLLSAIAELLLNCKKEAIPKSVKRTLTTKHGRAKKVLVLRKHWGKLRNVLRPLVQKLNGETVAENGIGGGNAAEKAAGTNK